MLKEEESLKELCENAYSYAIFPNVINEPVIGLEGVTGKGLVYKDKKITGTCTLDQQLISFELGGQRFYELILFQDEESYLNFKNDTLKFDKNTFATMLYKENILLHKDYINGVLIYTLSQDQLIYSVPVHKQKVIFNHLDTIPLPEKKKINIKKEAELNSQL